jgi:predicted DNA repair protein MutK
MASGLLLLLDDITSVLDDVATLTKVAVKKTSGVLGDDLALNAQQVTGVQANRELAIVWAVAKGSFVNKLILVPIALILSQVAPWGITPLLMIGGAFLCYEGFEKIVHKLLHSKHELQDHEQEHKDALQMPQADIVKLERDKVRGAIRTDFILSAEIIVISLGVVKDSDFTTKLAVLSSIAVIMTVGVYGLVAGIVKLDDLGMWLSSRGGISKKIGTAILLAAPYLMKFLSIAGTVAMFLVGGGILLHNIPFIHHWTDHALESHSALVKSLFEMILSGLAGLLAGAAIVLVVFLAQKAIGKKSDSPQTN